MPEIPASPPASGPGKTGRVRLRGVPDVRLRCRIGEATIEVEIPAKTVSFLHDSGIGFDYVLEGMEKLANKRKFEPPPKPASLDASWDDLNLLRPDGSWRSPHAAAVELFLRKNPGRYDTVTLTMGLYRCTEQEARKRLYERRGIRKKITSTTLCSSIRYSLNQALDVLQAEGWPVVFQQTGRGMIRRKTWDVRPPPDVQT